MSRKLTLGIDIGATKTIIGYLGSDHRIRIIGREKTPQDPDEAVRVIKHIIFNADLPDEIRNIGIACPGPLNQETGKIMCPPNLQLWDEFPLVKIIENEFRTEARLENDANAAALGESVYGVAKNDSTVFYMTISSGIGVGIVIDKKIHSGNKGLAGEIWSFPPSLFNNGHEMLNILDLASGYGMSHLALDEINKGGHTSLETNNLSGREIIKAFIKGDELAVRLVNNARKILNATLVFSSCLLSPDIIVLGGGLTSNPGWFVDPLKESFKKTMPLDQLKAVPVVSTELGDDNVIYGAIALFA